MTWSSRAALAGLLSLLPFTAAAAPPKREAVSFVAWWKSDSLCRELGLDEAQQKGLAGQLENLAITYQLAQTRLNEARARQSALLFDSTIDRETLIAFHRNEIEAPTEAMQQANFEARLAVRARLSREQLAAIERTHPRFFSARWFATSRVPVREGRVLVEDE
jgi:hypothetical protein